MRHLGLALCSVLVFSGCSSVEERPARSVESTGSTEANFPVVDPALATTTGSALARNAFIPVTGLAELEQLALARNGGLERLRFERHSFEARARGARAWPNPRLTYRESLVEVETRVGPQERSFGIEQPIPWPGLLDGHSSRATRQAEMVGAELDGARRNVLLDLRSYWAEYAYLGRAIDVRRETLAILGRLEESARNGLEAGRGSTSHVLGIGIEIARVENEIATLTERAVPLRSAIFSLVGESADRPLPFPTALDPREPEPADPRRMRALLVDRDATIARAEAQIRVAEADLDIAGYEGWPKLGLGVQTIITGDAINPSVSGSGDDPWIIGLQLELPIDRRRVRAAERSARDRRDGAIAAARQLELDRGAALANALFLRQDATRRVALYTESLIPKSEASFAATERAFTSGDGDFSTMIDAQRVLLDFRLSLERARIDRWLAGVRLRAFLGEPTLSGKETETNGGE